MEFLESRSLEDEHFQRATTVISRLQYGYRPEEVRPIYPSFFDAVSVLRRALPAFKDTVDLDLHAGNYMFRRDGTPVIIDPYYTDGADSQQWIPNVKDLEMVDVRPAA